MSPQALNSGLEFKALVTAVTVVTTKTRKIIIRCNEELYRKWSTFVAESGFKNYEEALDYLLSLRRAPKIERY